MLARGFDLSPVRRKVRYDCRWIRCAIVDSSSDNFIAWNALLSDIEAAFEKILFFFLSFFPYFLFFFLEEIARNNFDELEGCYSLNIYDIMIILVKVSLFDLMYYLKQYVLFIFSFLENYFQSFPNIMRKDLTQMKIF